MISLSSFTEMWCKSLNEYDANFICTSAPFLRRVTINDAAPIYLCQNMIQILSFPRHSSKLFKILISCFFVPKRYIGNGVSGSQGC